MYIYTNIPIQSPKVADPGRPDKKNSQGKKIYLGMVIFIKKIE